ncbi:hypothetical protein FRC19_007945 [Serendipita sp. 401]|nr:hypothetical protein FRC19_007945 [Serendipita sp. 401]
MKESLRRLNTQLKVLEALEDPKSRFSFTSSASAVTGTTVNPTPLIYHYEKSITELSRNLYDTAERYSTLLASFTGRSQEPAMSNNRSLFSRLPPETIVEILKFVIEDGSHHLGPFLFVDKRFYALAMSTPSLWCNISIKINSIFEESNKLSVQYIDSCLKYSGTTGLNIALDMGNVPHPGSWMTSVITDIKKSLPYRSTAIDMALEDVAEWNWDEYIFSYTFQQEKTKDLTMAVVGTAGLHMRRWKSFKFFPSNPGLQLGGMIWELFNHSMPNLERFELNGWVYNEYGEFINAFPQLTAVRYLNLPGDGLLGRVPLIYGLLKTLVVGYDYSGPFLDTLGECTGLQELTINTIRGSTLDKRDISFPLLKALSLSGNIDILENITFNTPCLESLTLIGDDLFGLPTVKARSILWRTMVLHNHDSTVESLQHLLQIRGIEELTIDFEGPEEIIPMVHEVISQRDASSTSSLQIVRVVDGDRHLDTIHLMDK